MSPPERPAAPVSLFFSYSNKDKALRDKLETHLSLLQTQGIISGWHDRRIEAGTEWDGAISRHLEEAGIILLLVSADFLATRYCWDVEIKRAMERHEAGTARVIPVIVRPVDAWHTAPFGKLQALPEKGEAVTTWKNRDEAFADIARGIREAAMSLAAGTQGPSPPRGTTALGQTIWAVPHPRNEFFEGRDAVIADLRKNLTRRRKAALSQAITGLGGIGKTQTAVEYAYRYRNKYKAILWLNAESTPALKAGYAELAGLLHLPHPENDLDAAILAVKQWLKTEPGWLLIFDNADDPALLMPFLPEADHGHILITSRAKDFQYLGVVNPVRLNELSISDATAFLLHRCGRQNAEAAERVAATELARELDGLPLALEQAAAYIVDSQASFARYLESYRTRGLKLVVAQLPALGRYARSVTTTWAANFEAVELESPAAADVLRFSAFLAPDAIPFELLTGGAVELGPPLNEALASADGDPLVVNDLLRTLARFSLIRIDGMNETYGIHRMVQEVLKDAMDDTARHLWAERAVRAAHRAFPDVEYENWSLCARQLPHALAVTSWLERDRMTFVEAGRVVTRIATYMYQTAQYADVEPLFLKSTEIFRLALGEQHPDYASALNNLAALYRAMGRHAEAEPLYVKSTEIRRLALGEQHPDYAASLNNLAALYRAMGRHAEAEPLYLKSTEISRLALGEQHPSYATALNNLALLYYAMGRHAEAEPLFHKSTEIRRLALGEQHPDYAASLNNLAGQYRALGRNAEAERIAREGLRSCGTPEKSKGDIAHKGG